jgi:NADH-quinone oxidoreductase subunit J
LDSGLQVQHILFWLFALLGITGGVGLILNRNPVYAALSLILNFFSIAGLYLTLQAEFLAVVQILVYAGAIRVLFLFVIMLLNLSHEPKSQRFEITRGLGFILGLGFVGEMIYIFHTFSRTAPQTMAINFDGGKTEKVGYLLMTQQLFPFEMISVVLLAALVGAIVIAKRHNYKED